MSFEYIDPLLEKLCANANTEDARRDYQSSVPQGLPGYEPSLPALLRDWLALSVTFQLQAPWFSKDDLPFHVLDNPVRRDRVFGAPCMAASSWKGLLRWTARMETGLLAHLESTNNEEMNKNKLKDWRDSAELVHLFGNERDEGEHFQRGALAFRPTWFDKVGFEVINPHDRTKKAGTKPVLYEVVPPGSTGTLNVLYAPMPGVSAAGVDRQKAMLLLFDAVESLLTEYGFSAKRTSGWGVATISNATLRWRDGSRNGKLSELCNEAKKLVGGAE
jgi:CRISPR-associated protein Cmr2